MKDVTHHLRHLQKKVIQSNRKVVQEKSGGSLNGNSETMSFEPIQNDSNQRVKKSPI